MFNLISFQLKQMFNLISFPAETKNSGKCGQAAFFDSAWESLGLRLSSETPPELASGKNTKSFKGNLVVFH